MTFGRVTCTCYFWSVQICQWLPNLSTSLHLCFTSTWHGNPRTWGWLYVCTSSSWIWISSGASLVPRHSVRCTHTVLKSGKGIGWSLQRGSQTIQVHPDASTNPNFSCLSQCPWEIGWSSAMYVYEISWTTSLLFWYSAASVKMRSQMNMCVHWLESCKWTRVIRS